MSGKNRKLASPEELLELTKSANWDSRGKKTQSVVIPPIAEPTDLFTAGMLDGYNELAGVLDDAPPPKSTGSARKKAYREYLSSPEWKIRRDMKLQEAGHRCQLCNTPDDTLHVHHRTYERLRHEHPMDLIVLCNSCHFAHHQRQRGIDDDLTAMLEQCRKTCQSAADMFQKRIAQSSAQNSDEPDERE